VTDFFARYPPPTLPTPPPWKCTKANGEDDPVAIKKLTDWTNVELDRRVVHGDLSSLTDEEWLDIAMKDADAGDLTLLKRIYPHLQRFFCTPKTGGRGRRRPRNEYEVTRVQAAFDDVFLIREIWKHAYKKWVRRRKPTAVQIAAGRNGVVVSSVRKAVKNKSRYQNRPSLRSLY
jgi:hypothetical protein